MKISHIPLPEFVRIHVFMGIQETINATKKI